MGPILEWAKEWQALVTVVGTTLLFLYVRETYLIRLATITSGAPSVRLFIAFDDRNRPFFQVRNIEGHTAYSIRLDGFSGYMGNGPVKYTFEAVPYLRPGESADLDGIIETAGGREYDERYSGLEVLRSATGRITGLPLRLRYQDGTGMTYVVRVMMPSRLYLGFMAMAEMDVQPDCSPPIPMTSPNRVEDRIIWPIVRAVKHRKIKREIAVRRRRGKEASDAFRRAALEAAGFRGFVTVEDLREGRIDDVPGEPGNYVVLRERDDPPTFLQESPAGRFKGKNPTVDNPALKAAWVLGAHALYIGMTSQRDGLRARLKDLIDFGAGQAVGHWGGRYLWQVPGSSDFVVAWRESSPGVNPLDEEKELLRRFRETYGRLPFANLQD